MTTATLHTDRVYEPGHFSPLPRVIGIHGFARSGKDTIAQFLFPLEYERLAFADKMREALYALNPYVAHDNRGRAYRLQTVVDEEGWDEAKSLPEIRRLLQAFGTEAGREIHGDDVWVNLALGQMEPEKRYVFTDVRFPNEIGGLQALPADQTLLVKVKRPGVGPVNGHASDAGLPDHLFDVVINNDGTLEDLQNKVLDALTVL